MLWKILRWFLFHLNAEQAHHLMFLLIRFGIQLGNLPLKVVSGEVRSDSEKRTVVEVFGKSFASRIGLAAGFDKNAEILAGLPALGFGFAEIGTVTPRPQAGNPRPRLFRDPQRQALFNRMGFNGLGATIVSKNVRMARERLPSDFRVGINIGKNKDTPIEQAFEDYVRVAKAFEGLADYMVINVSSPNTVGLRSLQTVEALKPIIYGVRKVIVEWKKVPPLLLKLAPELIGSDLSHLIQEVEALEFLKNEPEFSRELLKVDGWVLTNTLAGTYRFEGMDYSGGWSGSPLVELAKNSLKTARTVTSKPIISVGGISSAVEAQARIALGANLIQVYTGWIYGGPAFPRRLRLGMN